MEDNANLLDDYSPPEPDLEDYKKKYRNIRIISWLATSFAFLLYAFFIDKTTGKDDGVAYRIGSAFGIFLVVTIPATFIAALLALSIDKKFPYKERFKKIFWGISLWLSVVLIAFIGLIIAMNKKLF
jgi:polyferredoxin